MARERETRAVPSTVTPKKSTGDLTCRRIMAWAREIGLEFADISVNSDNEPALTSLIASWSTLRAMESGLRMIIENGPVGSSKSNGIVERAIQFVPGMFRTTRSAIEVKWEVKIDVKHSVWPWISEQAGVLLRRFEASRNGKRAYERLHEKSAKGQALPVAARNLWKKTRPRSALGRLMCMWEDGVCLGIKATTAGTRGKPEWFVAHKNGPEEDSERTMGTKQTGDDRGGSLAQERRRCHDGWRTSQRRGHDDGQGLLGSWRWKNMYRYRRECTYHVKTWRCSVQSALSQVHVVGLGERRRDKSTKKTAESGLKKSLGGTVKAEAARRRVKEYQDIAAEVKLTKEIEPRGKTSGCTNNKNEFEQQQRGTGMFKQQWRSSENKQLQRKQWIQQSGQQEESRW